MDHAKQYAHGKMKCRISAIGLVIGLCITCSVEAELKPINETSLANITGQAGLTLEIDMRLDIGEISYRDEGYFALEDFAWGGADRTGNTGVTGNFENWKMVIDIAGDSESLAYGFSELDQYHREVNSPDSAWDTAILVNDDEQTYSEGDLVIHNTSTQLFDGTRYDRDSDSDVALPGGPTTLPGDSFSETMDDWRNSAPFAIKIGAVKLHDSSYTIGSKTTDGTTLMSNFNAEVLTGPLDIIIQNRGNGSTNGIPDSKIIISDYFEISDLSATFDFLALSISGFKLHNRRGDTTGLNMNRGLDGIAGTADDVATESFGFAHAKWYMAAAPSFSKGIQIAGALKGDIDMPEIYVGGTSIGSVFITDMLIESKMNIRGH
ncbi:MAG: hypothetical protein H6999_09325 [Hahellaceae bacterium]|nr:hypothetical protein [Hahellaceae bacterium]MCP5169943.1 hypothetical protein [Hahellaceae bacterium]